ncbi:MAG TPA: PDZ domain-containing protein [Gemmatimonadaceae bacterium]|nr:PDZ domain-containing protein [Gemmatimonadaceae bacterium]
MRVQLFLSAATIVVISGDALAQNTPSRSRPDSACMHYPDGRVECVKTVRILGGDSVSGRVFFHTDSALMKRAALGVELRATGTRRDTLGVFIAAVTPKGPAEAAGIVEGDRIAAINGVDVRSAAGDIDDAYTNGLASHRLTREVHKLAPGARVTLRVYSGGRFRDVSVTAGRASEVLRQAGVLSLRMPSGGERVRIYSPDGALGLPDLPLRLEQLDPKVLPEVRSLLRGLPRATELRRLAPPRSRAIRQSTRI